METSVLVMDLLFGLAGAHTYPISGQVAPLPHPFVISRCTALERTQTDASLHVVKLDTKINFACMQSF